MFKKIHNLQLIRELKNKVVLLEYHYPKDDVKIDHQSFSSGVVIAADINKGVTVLEHHTGKRLHFPPSFQSWEKIPKSSYKNPESGEIIRNAEFRSRWIVCPGTNKLSPSSVVNQSQNSSCSSVYGIGTHLYGTSPKFDDRSYITTKWVIFLLIPILPLASFRIMPRIMKPTLGIVERRHTAFEVPLNIKQVVEGYAFTLLAIILIALITLKPLG